RAGSSIGRVSTTAPAIAGNYQLTTTTTTATANITQRTLHVTALGQNKTYDGTNTATVTFSDDRVGGDVFTVIYSAATFNNKSVANGKPISVTGISLTGTDSGNYSVASTASASANITALSVSPSVPVNNKAYDGTTSSALAARTADGST